MEPNETKLREMHEHLLYSFVLLHLFESEVRAVCIRWKLMMDGRNPRDVFDFGENYIYAERSMCKKESNL